MNDPFVMGGLEARSNLESDVECGLKWEGTSGQELGERVAFDEFEDEEPGAVVFFEAVDCCDVRMVQRCQQLGFTFKPGEAFFVVGKLFRQGLDGDFASEFGISCTPDLAHATFSEGRNDFIVCKLGTGLNHPYI